MKINNDTTVGDVAAAMPAAIAVFERLGIDYCCGGKTRIGDALAESGLDMDAFLALVDDRQAERAASAEREDLRAMSPAVLSAYIEDTHHDYLRAALPEIGRLLEAVLRAHGKNHRELFSVYTLFGRLRTELEQHLVKEEAMLFPALAGAEDAEALAGEIRREHEAAGALLAALRAEAGDYAPPADACATYRRVYELLPEMERDLHRHIHIENNILLKGHGEEAAGA